MDTHKIAPDEKTFIITIKMCVRVCVYLYITY